MSSFSIKEGEFSFPLSLVRCTLPGPTLDPSVRILYVGIGIHDFSSNL